MKRLLFAGKASALSDWLKKESYLNKGWSVANYIDNLARERQAKSVLVGNNKQTSRAATLK